jgi:hypothetical protein
MSVDSSRHSDFLANVIERAQERASIIAPRPTSLFEPTAATQQPGQEEPALPESGQDVAPPAVDLRRAAWPEVGTRSGDQRTPIADGPDKERALPTRAWQPVVRTSDSADDRSRQHDALPPLPPAVQTTIARAPLVAPNLHAPAVDRQVIAELHQGDARSPDMPEPMRPRRFDFAAPTHDAVRPRVASLLPNRELVTSRASSPADGQGSRQAPQQQGTAPAVTISIGRVEVRAAAPVPKPAARAKPARQPMRLDEYLERKAPRS